MHLWIIMDWNRRWAKSKNLLSIFWHKAWYDNALKIVELASNKNIEYLTLWALSKENLLKRDKDELKWIIRLINKLSELKDKLLKENIKFETIWNIEKLPEKSKNILLEVKNHTKNNTWLKLIIALAYSWEDEIVRAVRKFVDSWNDVNNLDEESFRSYLDTAHFPKPDLIIRTGWDIRHSGFLLYDSDYSEYFFSKKLWPDFDEEELEKALDFYNSSKRNFWI